MKVMNDFDKLALDQASLLLNEVSSVRVLVNWVPVNVSKSAWRLDIELKLLYTIPTDSIPEYSNWSVIIDFENDKWGHVDIYPSLEGKVILSTFPHQQYNGGSHPIWPVRNGHICTLLINHGLAMSRNALLAEPKHTAARIVWHVERALEWLTAAANNKLNSRGDHFELPDFNTGEGCREIGLAYLENSQSFIQWENANEKAGIANISRFNKTIFLRNFMDEKGKNLLFEPEWGSYVLDMATQKAVWIRLDKIPVINNWQVPSTKDELKAFIESQGRDWVGIIKRLMTSFGDFSECILLIGFPIPETVGGKNSRYHWQGLILSPTSKNISSTTIRAGLTVNHWRSRDKIIWFKNSQNWDSNELQNRGRISDFLREANVLLVGCGSFGSNVAEQLVRMGLVNLTVVDNKLFEPGNLVRHTLDINHINMPKAISLQGRLNKINPLSKINAFVLSVPNDDEKFNEIVKQADILLDFTADDNLMNELPLKGLSPSTLIISCSIGLYAKRLFFYADLSSRFNSETFNEHFQEYRIEEHKLAESESLPRGTGCWHPVVPAPLNRIAGLAAIAVELVEQIYNAQSNLPVFICHEWAVPEMKDLAKRNVA